MATLSIDGLPLADRPTVLLGFEPDPQQMALIFELADEWGWDLLDLVSLEYLEGGIPSELPLGGALIKDLPDSALATELRSRGCPAVRLGRLPHPQDSKLPVVLPDQAAAGRLAAEHFVERRFKELGIVTYNASNPGMEHHPLWAAFCECAGELGVRSHTHDFMRPEDRTLSGEERFEKRAGRLAAWVGEIPKPVGVLTIGEDMAIQIYRMCLREHIQIPDEVALLSGNNKRHCRLTPMPMSGIDTEELGCLGEAMRLLKRLIAGEPAPTSPVMVPPSRIVERRSTDVLAVSDPLVARALRFIWEHICDNPSVDEVADALEIPRRRLERSFRSALGCGVKSEIMRRRLQVFCRLLRSSDDPIVELSAQMGYRSTEAMHRQFRKAMGTSPAAYRRARRGEG